MPVGSVLVVCVIPDPDLLRVKVALVRWLISELDIPWTRLVIYNRVSLGESVQLLRNLSDVLRMVVYSITKGPRQQAT